MEHPPKSNGRRAYFWIRYSLYNSQHGKSCSTALNLWVTDPWWTNKTTVLGWVSNTIGSDIIFGAVGICTNVFRMSYWLAQCHIPRSISKCLEIFALWLDSSSCILRLIVFTDRFILIRTNVLVHPFFLTAWSLIIVPEKRRKYPVRELSREIATPERHPY